MIVSKDVENALKSQSFIKPKLEFEKYRNESGRRKKVKLLKHENAQSKNVKLEKCENVENGKKKGNEGTKNGICEIKMRKHKKQRKRLLGRCTGLYHRFCANSLSNHRDGTS